MTDTQITAEQLLSRGPNRVLISSEEALPSRRARERHGVTPDIIFIRKDGWTLGAPTRFAAAAYRMWRDNWVGFMRRPETSIRPIEEYHTEEDTP